MSAIRAAHPTARLELWAMDEHRLGLKPLLRRVWAQRGGRLWAIVRPRYEWCYRYAFVHPRSGRLFWLLLPTVRTDVFSLALAELAEHLGVDAEHRLVLVLDQAGWHVSANVDVPDGIDLVFLPAFSPELQPAERLWTLTGEAVANTCFADLASLEAAQAEHCRFLSAQPDRISRLTCYHQWPDETAM